MKFRISCVLVHTYNSRVLDIYIWAAVRVHPVLVRVHPVLVRVHLPPFGLF